MVKKSYVYFIKGLHMPQNFILNLFELHWHVQLLYRTLLIVIYFVVLLLWFIEFGRIFELYKIHWINQNWLTILQDRSKIYISICCQAFWVVKLFFDSKFWYAYSYFCGLKHSKSHCFLCQLTKINFGTPMQRYVSHVL